MKQYKYILEPYRGMKTRYHCPSCHDRERTFSLYIDTETGEHVHPSVGRCNRESNCGYHYTPKQYFEDNRISSGTGRREPYKPQPITVKPKPISFIPFNEFKASLSLEALEGNHFVKYLIKLFGAENTGALVSRYFIASSSYWKGATVFWQIDARGKIRTGKIMLYSPDTGKRVKEPFNHINWVHKALKVADFELKQCLFGEHLLADKTKPVAIVESEKTAVIASAYLPQFIWVAVGSLTNLNEEKCSVLKGRTVTLFPDLNGFEKWSEKAKALSEIAAVTVSDLLEKKATEGERKQGLDLADYLIRFSLNEFQPLANEVKKQPPSPQPKDEAITTEPLFSDAYFTKPEKPPLKSWEQDITELEKFFTVAELPTVPIRLSQSSTITDCSKFVKSHLAFVKANNGNSTFLPYLSRLQELKQILNTKTN